MLNPPQLELLLRGDIAAWNNWFIKQPRGIVIDLTTGELAGQLLSDVDLHKAVMRGADLEGSKLFSATLEMADLGLANLTYALMPETNLHRANLSGANLSDALLVGANLTRATLTGANLERADLSSAVIRYTTLTDANIAGAIFHDTVFADVDLSSVRGLEFCIHRGPSTLDHRTLLRSGKTLPRPFLVGCGLPNSLIDYLPSLLEVAPIQFYSCFISYASEDEEFVTGLHADLQAKGIRCWYAPHDFRGGKHAHEQVDEAIRVHDRLLLVLSPDSIASSWVRFEIAKARHKEVEESRRVLFPISLVPYENLQAWELFDPDLGEDTAKEIRKFYIPDFSRWKVHDTYLAEFKKLVEALGCQ